MILTATMKSEELKQLDDLDLIFIADGFRRRDQMKEYERVKAEFYSRRGVELEVKKTFAEQIRLEL